MNWRSNSSSAMPSMAGRRTDLGGFLAILLNYKWSILAAALLGLATAFIALSFISPVYVASGAVFVDPRSRKIVTEDVIQGGLGADAALVESQVAIITSESVLKRVVTAEKLAGDPEFAPEPQTGFLADIKAIVRGPRPAVDPEILAVENLARSVSVDRAQKSYVIGVSVAAGSPEKAARLANAILAAYTLDQTEAKAEEARRANTLIDARLDELREQVRRSETRVDEFKKANKILTSEGGFLSEQQLGKLNAELATARAVAAEARARFNQVKAAARTDTADTLPEALKSGLLQRLRDQYAQVSRRAAALSAQLRDRHPTLIDVKSQLADLQNQIDSELERVALAALSEQRIAEARERELVRAIDTAKEEVSRTATAQIKLRELEQEVALSRELLGAFLARAKETQEQVSLSTPEARVISEATLPTRPNHPIPLLILTLGLLGGLGAGLARALIADALRDPTDRMDAMKSAEPGAAHPAASQPFALPALSTPSMSDRIAGILVKGAAVHSGFADVLAAVSSASAVSATVKTYKRAVTRLLDAVRAGAEEGKPRIVLIAGDRLGAGASSTALALAYTAALDGERVLLVDATSGDTALSDVFAKSFTATSVTVLDNRDDLKAITTRDARSGLTFLPIALADLRHLKAPQRRRLVSGLSSLATDFDLVLIDAGDVANDEAARSLATAADVALLTSRTERADSTALEVLRQTIGGGEIRHVVVGRAQPAL
ncbi:MAG: exopolysaccharide transport family protein [Hyphomicrobium sp.]|nr:exopolysaccharide transport family protein [Hyphomicrobium sp.]